MLLTVSILDWLLGLHRVSWSDPRAAIGWRYAMPLWGWLLILAVSALIAGWSYRRLLGPRWARIALGVLRTALIVLLVAFLLGPMLVVNQELVEQDSLLVLVDESASMRIRDMEGTAGDRESSDASSLISREEALRQALTRHADLFGDQKLGKDRRIVWLGFNSNTFEINPLAAPTTQPDDQRQTTALRTAIEQALQRAAGQPVSGLIVMSDGRSPQSTGGTLVRRLQQQAVNVFAVPLGANQTPLDLAVGQVDAPRKAFINDPVPVTVYLDHYPTEVRVDPARVRVRLIDEVTNKTLDEQQLVDDLLREPVRLSAVSAVVGPVKWKVEVSYDGRTATTAPVNRAASASSQMEPAAGVRDISRGELILENNHRELALELVDQPLGVLYVEGYPRWEYRYLKNMLVREKSVRSSMMLISADRDFAQEGQLPITRLPATMEEIKPYDVIVIGDVPSTYFSPEQLRLIADHVSARGAGLLWIGGEYDTPRSYEGTPLAALLPMCSPGSVSRIDPSLGPISMCPTKLAEALQVLRLRSNTTELSGPTPPQTWPAGLPPHFWAQNLGELKTSAEVLATSNPLAGRSFPLVTRLRYGAGQVVYVATDESWRWRAGRGELYFEQFWMQLVRMLGRGRLQQGAGRAVLTASDRRAELDQPVVVTVRLQDELLSQREMSRIRVAVIRQEDAAQPGGGRDRAVEQLELLPLPTSSESPATGGKVFQAVWHPASAGAMMLRVVEPTLDDLNLTQEVEVIRADDELRQPAPDRERLAMLAAATGGKVVPLDRLDELENLIPNRARRTPNDIREPLWNSYLALFAIVTLISAEWIGRKMIRLV
ncbi:MAG: hypothetical protein IT444_01240 [Phycisphaeraceae bacterium]|nr:hypothetical protein [Phycisphaeraceae bacterium]